MANDRFEQEVMRALGNIEGTVDSILREQEEQKKYIISVSKRVGSLEQYRARVAGIASFVAAIVGTAVSFLIDTLGS